MSQAVFITGFNNWGKSQIIFNLFNRQHFERDKLYHIEGLSGNIGFTVQSQSNEDFRGRRYIEHIADRIEASPNGGEYLFTTLCPSIEPNSNFIEILSNVPFIGYDMRHFLLIEYKWDMHAKLLVENILTAGRQIENANFIVINEGHDLRGDTERRNARMGQIRRVLKGIFEKQE